MLSSLKRFKRWRLFGAGHALPRGSRKRVGTFPGPPAPIFFSHEDCDLLRRDVRRRQGRSAHLLSLRRTGLPQALRPADRDFRGDVWGGLHLLSSLLARARFRIPIGPNARLRATRSSVVAFLRDASESCRWRMRGIFTSGALSSIAISTPPQTPATLRCI